MRTILLAVWAMALLVLLGLNLLSPLPGQEGSWPWVLGMAAFPVAAFLVLRVRPGNGVGLAMALVATSTGWIFLLAWIAFTFPGSRLSLFAEALMALGYVGQFAGLAALLHLYSTGRPMAGWHTRFFAGALLVVAALALLLPLRPGPMEVTGRHNPLGVEPLGELAEVGFAVVAFFALCGLVVLGLRWRQGDPQERERLKWFLVAGVVVATLFGVLLTGVFRDGPVRVLVGGAFAVVAFWSVPAAVVVAVTRHRLWDIDRLISRTVSYGVVAGVLVTVYVVGVLALRGVLPAGGDLSVAVSTLIAAALFNPLRRRVQASVDRIFNRTQYDAEQELERFSMRRRAAADPGGVTDDLLAVVGTSIQPASASVWLRERESP